MARQVIRVCFVCLGNICRSPTAEAVVKDLIDKEGLANRLKVDSAGTGGWHVGEQADERSRAAAKARGIAVTSIARQVREDDFDHFDYLIAMDQSNERNLRRLAPTKEARTKVSLFRSYDPLAPEGAEVPDPYYGGENGFDEVFDICARAGRGLIRELKKKHHLDADR
ncbi:MAG: low molecular weight protein-tyrosine-phosphatase [Myxococcota bacterium]